MQKRREIPISAKMIHLNAKIIGRGGVKPQSAVASAAYRSATKIYCEYDGEIKDFSRKGHVIYSEILLPEYAPKEFADRSVLWNAVENFEKGSRAQLSREVEFSLPCELDADERLKAARTLAEFFRNKGILSVSAGSVLCIDSGVVSTSFVSSAAGNISVWEVCSLLSEKENGSGIFSVCGVLLQPVNAKSKSIVKITVIFNFIRLHSFVLLPLF